MAKIIAIVSDDSPTKHSGFSASIAIEQVAFSKPPLFADDITEAMRLGSPIRKDSYSVAILHQGHLWGIRTDEILVLLRADLPMLVTHITSTDAEIFSIINQQVIRKFQARMSYDYRV